ncbi:hypothetical protein [Streptomyces sp. DH41]|uniref:hypothetical protein n=1 Tax=Streptomyces sp. DH41 TaxID=3040125 RepID=UPI0024431DBF|nr:hypothetical protein [Streptomyces sp. DH41]MDG9726472.1 hypothetical protein [Streptomyces sp. DH41]
MSETTTPWRPTGPEELALVEASDRAVGTGFLERCPVRRAGGETILELWVPAAELEEFNRYIVGRIEVVREFHARA